jgi:hypothetical protein
MPKSFDSEKLISSTDLREIGNHKLFDELLSTFKKLGLVHNNQLRAVILDIRTYEELMSRLEEMEDLLEDRQLAEELEDRLRLPREQWKEKPDQLSRLQFLEQMLKDKGSAP